MIVAALPAGVAAADGPSGAPAGVPAFAGALPASLSAAQRGALLAAADANSARTAAALKLGPKEALVVRGVTQDADGTVHTRYERTFDGLPVLGGDLVVHTARDGTSKGDTRATGADIAVDTSPEESAEAAKGLALAGAAAAKVAGAAAGDARKVVWAGSGTPRLAWETVVTGTQEDGTPSELHVVTDANSGKKIFEYQGIETGLGTSKYSGQVTIGTSAADGGGYAMTDPTRGGHSTYDLNGTSSTRTLFTNPTDTWGDGTVANRQTAAVDAAYGAQLTWDYYQNVHGRDGIKDDGVGAHTRVHYGKNYVNAFWSDTCFCMTYGDGAGNVKPLTSIDVGGHEMTHGITSATAGLIYRGESGGLNEATSDIMAAAIEFWAGNPEDQGDYLVGEKIDIRGDGTPLRYMDKPSKDGRSRDAWSADLGTVDVHYSSGPANHWFYLASEGSGAKTVNGVAYDSPTSDGLPVTAIGRDAAARIWYRALTTYMTSSTDYAAARTATLRATADLYGQLSATYMNAANAWAAVNVGPRVVDGLLLDPVTDQVTEVGAPAELEVRAINFNPGAVTYHATGLPDGVRLHPVTGRITGTPATAGTHTVTVTAKASHNSRISTTFGWKVSRGIFANAPPVPIPDGGPAVFSDISVDRIPGAAPSDLKVAVDIKHTWRGDLAVDLIGPDGTVYSLKKASLGDSADNVLETYTVDASTQQADGTWRLRVQDMYRSDSGRIDSWKIIF
ncbi:M4 family metallopeptidase [Kitasatospora purpeofusca]|uniref:M4 family metallopeptidase n=1 Tax=Kitasatospora purpeofusca TaxID=67352 RepID=UPI002A59BB89|nr:M4 family metallopeptidase [Kitasatospora purpeofusca]MDY0816715.1 M4 family metallopeptidase [Kitasatospora purpeofusca]